MLTLGVTQARTSRACADAQEPIVFTPKQSPNFFLATPRQMISHRCLLEPASNYLVIYLFK